MLSAPEELGAVQICASSGVLAAAEELVVVKLVAVVVLESVAFVPGPTAELIATLAQTITMYNTFIFIMQHELSII